jgi:hypothetical protein
MRTLVVDRDLGPLAGEEIGDVNPDALGKPNAKTRVV